ncbi:MAG: exodeoxyribonuclease VII large subunit [Eubacteriales bacterium]
MNSLSAQPRPAEILSVSQLSEYIKTLLESNQLLGQAAVRGELSGFTRHRSGHLYFSLKDEGALLRCVMFRSDAARLLFVPENGMKLVARGTIGVYVRDGQYQLYVRALEPDGVGALFVAYEQLRAKLAAEGLFDESRKKPLPRYPTAIGVVTSDSGAAIADIVRVLTRRYLLARIVLYPALVQGEDAPPQLMAGIRYFNQTRAVDLLIIGRGGGSMEDLWAFNHEGLVRAIAASAIPVISAVGHETDYTLCDFVADFRAPTPSAAAEAATPDRMELFRYLSTVKSSLTHQVTARLAAYREQLEQAAAQSALTSTHRLFRDQKQALAYLTEALCRAGERTLAEHKSALATLAARLDGLSPLSVLARGYALVRDEAGHSVVSAAQARAQEQLTLTFADGSLPARVTKPHRGE